MVPYMYTSYLPLTHIQSIILFVNNKKKQDNQYIYLATRGRMTMTLALLFLHKKAKKALFSYRNDKVETAPDSCYLLFCSYDNPWHVNKPLVKPWEICFYSRIVSAIF